MSSLFDKQHSGRGICSWSPLDANTPLNKSLPASDGDSSCLFWIQTCTQLNWFAGGWEWSKTGDQTGESKNERDGWEGEKTSGWELVNEGELWCTQSRMLMWWGCWGLDGGVRSGLVGTDTGLELSLSIRGSQKQHFRWHKHTSV